MLNKNNKFSRRLHRLLIASAISVATFLAVVLVGCEKLYSAFPGNSFSSSDSLILVDQFGYRPQDRKIAVIVQSDAGSSLDTSYPPRYLSDSYSVVLGDTSTPVFQAEAQIWNHGTIHDQSGDRAAWFDFTDVSQPGTYVIQNVRTGETSASFEIAEDVYHNALVAATRMYFYQRSGFPKHPPYADDRWTDGAAFIGPGQDTEARFVGDKTNPMLERDMQGGWFDAGDTNKYVPFAVQPIHQLLDAYAQAPDIWTDNFNIPESGNGIPDLLDEINFELAWLQRMQDADGGAYIKVGTLDYDSAEKPSLDRRPRFYGPKCSSSTIAVSSMFSHAALVFRSVPELSPESEVLTQKAVSAWEWFLAHPSQTDCDNQEIQSGDADSSIDSQMSLALSAAVYLFALTENPEYETFISQYLHELPLFDQLSWSVYEPYIGDALLFYSSLDIASTENRDKITDAFTNLVNQRPDIYRQDMSLDPYLAYMPNDQYHWGSNQVKSNIGNTNLSVILYGIDPDHQDSYQDKALGLLHYIHGVNPLGMTYITNMYEYGADNSANEMYHEWFGQGIYSNALTSPNGPAPGYITGGPNKNYTGSAPLASLPPMKAYMDSNKGWDLNMWEITEPAIYYQSAYIKLLSNFVASSKP